MRNSLSSCLVVLLCACGDGRSNDDDVFGNVDDDNGSSSALDNGESLSDSDNDEDSASGANSNEAPDDTNDDTGDDAIKFDVLGLGDAASDCGGQGGKIESYIWIANSPQGSVSKIDTRELLEVGRYQVRPDGGGDPSRTSVNQSNDVAVLARGGGLTKIRGDIETCADTNGTAGIQTSSGNGQILAWDQEECRAWHTPIALTNMRAVAWTSGTFDDQACAYTDQHVWAAGNMDGMAGTGQVLLVDGEVGAILETIDLPDDLPLPIGHGPYGAVVDGDDNLWIAQVYVNWLIKVDRQDFSVTHWNEPIHTYGVSIDSDGYLWACNREVARFDPATATWSAPVLIEDWQGFFGHAGSCTTDAAGRLWKSINDKLYAIDRQTMQVVDTIVMPEGMIWGLAVDYDGYVWGIPRNGSTAYRVDPDTHEIESVGGLVGAYTYSDMTGFLLDSVAAG
jgi:hypothetical protein